MKYLLAFILIFGITATSSVAHCGACGAEKNHDHDSKSLKINSIIETASEVGSFKTLLAAVEAAGLGGTLAGEGPYTVFAPTDEAFAALPEGTVESLLQDKEKLASILTYHVLSGSVEAKDVVKIKNAKTLNGQSISIKIKDDVVMLDNAKVITTDIICSNGVIHVIDAVILPKM
jgi:uncharacterized surface protein with fasciclin (FAS1) repeats